MLKDFERGPVNNATFRVIFAGAGKSCSVIVQRGNDIALERLDAHVSPSKLGELTRFTKLIDESLRGKVDRPTEDELREFGKNLYRFFSVDDVERCIGALPRAFTCFEFVSIRPDLQSLPWEYLRFSNEGHGPLKNRCVVRLVPTIGMDAPDPLEVSKESRLRVLFVYSDPNDQMPVSWDENEARLRRLFSSESLKELVEFKCIEGNRLVDLRKLIEEWKPHVFHFNGHGKVLNGVGGLILTDLPDRVSHFVSSSQLTSMLNGSSIRVVILSACNTARGDFSKGFKVVASALVSAGVPAVVATQFPLRDKSVAAFTIPLYESLLARGDIDEAFMEGRVNLYLSLDGCQGANLEWGIPVLYRHIDGTRILRPSAEAQTDLPLEATEAFPPTKGVTVDVEEDAPISSTIESLFVRLLTHEYDGCRDARAEHAPILVGVWDLDVRMGFLQAVIEKLNGLQSPVQFIELDAAVPGGLIAQRSKIRKWLQEAHPSKVKTRLRQQSMIIASEYFAIANALRKRNKLDYVIGITSHLIASQEVASKASRRSADWQRREVIQGKSLLISVDGLRKKREPGAVVATLAMQRALSCMQNLAFSSPPDGDGEDDGGRSGVKTAAEALSNHFRTLSEMLGANDQNE